MIKFERLPKEIMKRIKKAQSVLGSHPQVLFAYLFGGLTRGEPRPLSDVDIAVYITETADPTQAKLEILGLLLDALGTDEIDLVILNSAPLTIQARVLMNRALLADNDPFFRHKYESLTLRKYFDFSIKESANLKGRYGLG